jgi:uncharacterized protein YbjQ (UPF0145 family)
MEELIPILIQIAIFGGLILLGLFAGSAAEKRHIRSLDERESALADMLITDVKGFPGGASPTPTPELIVGEVSIASDYLKTFLAGLRNLIGGEVRSFETLQLRARREAILRVMEQARDKGFNAIGNLRLEMSDIAGGVSSGKKQKMVVVSVIASATGYRR